MCSLTEEWDKVKQCALCGSSTKDHVEFAVIEDHNINLHYSLCTVCGLVFQSPRMSQSALDRFYSRQYRKVIQDSENPTEKDLRVQSGRANTLLQFVRREIGSIHRHLDIGSSAGMLLKRFRSDYGCESIGIEPGDAYRNYAAGRELRVYPELASLEAKHERAFDLVSMSHVLEHIPDPLEYLIYLRERWITPDGTILIEVPNLYGHQSFELAHLYAYTAATLKELLHQAGFGILRMRIHGRPRSLLIPLYLTVLARSRSENLSPRRIRSRSFGVQFRRRLGMIWRRLASTYFSRWAWLPWPDSEY